MNSFTKCSLNKEPVLRTMFTKLRNNNTTAMMWGWRWGKIQCCLKRESAGDIEAILGVEMESAPSSGGKGSCPSYRLTAPPD